MFERLTGSRRALLAVLAGAGVVGLVTLVAVAGRAGRVERLGGEESHLPPAVRDVIFTVVVVLAAALLAGVLGRPRLVRGKGRSGTFQLWTIPIFVAVAVGLWFVLQRAEIKESQDEERFSIPPGQQQVPREQTPPPGDGGGGLAFRWEVGVGLGAAAAAALAALAVAHRRRRVNAPYPSAGEQLANAFDLSLDDLRTEADPRRAVIAAYARAEQALAASGMPRRAAEAPLEYLARVLERFAVRPEAALELTQLFERAKFSAHAIGEDLRADAIAALVTVRDDLRTA